MSQTSEAKNDEIVADGENAAYLCNVERNKRPPEDKNKENRLSNKIITN